MNNYSALRRITSLTPKEIAGLKVKNRMSLAGEKSPHRRSIVIQKDRVLNDVNVEESFETIVEKIAGVIANNRVEVENALIATGSPRKVRLYNRKALNAEVQNRLVGTGKNSQAFRQYMTVLVGSMYGRSLKNDGFFRTGLESKAIKQGVAQEAFSSKVDNSLEDKYGAGDNDELEPSTTFLPTRPATVIDSSVSDLSESSTILPFIPTQDGGVKKTMGDQDWGSILQGSADVISSVGGVIGLFTGGNQSGNESVLDQYNDDKYQEEDKKYKQGGMSMLWKVIIGLVVVAVIVFGIRYFVKKGKN
jgi:hypothetical protein